MHQACSTCYCSTPYHPPYTLLSSFLAGGSTIAHVVPRMQLGASAAPVCRGEGSITCCRAVTCALVPIHAVVSSSNTPGGWVVCDVNGTRVCYCLRKRDSTPLPTFTDHSIHTPVHIQPPTHRVEQLPSVHPVPACMAAPGAPFHDDAHSLPAGTPDVQHGRASPWPLLHAPTVAVACMHGEWQ